MRSSLELEIGDSNLGLVKSDPVLPTLRLATAATFFQKELCTPFGVIQRV